MSTLSDKEIEDIIKMGGAIKGRPLMPSHPQLTAKPSTHWLHTSDR